MQNTPAIAELESRAVLRVGGKDVVTFLQNLISQDMKGAVEGKAIFTALLTPQGKYLYDFFVIPDGGSFLLDAEAERASDFLAALTRFRIRGDVTLEDARNDYSVFALWHEHAPQPSAFVDPRHVMLGQRYIAKKAAGLSANADEADYREHRYSLGVAEGSHEIAVNNATLLEINFDALNAISFDKGCYMGQELTARTHYRGLIKRRYLPFRYKDTELEKDRFISTSEDVNLGDIATVGKTHGIGLFHLENTKPNLNKQIRHGTGVIEIFVPDYLEKFIR